MIDADPVATAVRAVMARQTVWMGTASELLGTLAEAAGERVAKAKTWPDTPRALAGRLRRAATFLRKIGIEFTFRKQGRVRTRMIDIVNTHGVLGSENAAVQPSAQSASSAPIQKFNRANDLSTAKQRTVAKDADGTGKGVVPTVRARSLKSNAGGAADGADAKIGRLSGTPETKAPAEGNDCERAEALRATCMPAPR